MKSDWVTVREAAEITGYNAMTIYGAIARGDIEARWGIRPIPYHKNGVVRHYRQQCRIVDLECVELYFTRPSRVAEIEAMHKRGEGKHAIAREFGIKVASVERALQRAKRGSSRRGSRAVKQEAA